MKLNFFKYQGTGNDFILLDNRKGQFDGLRPEQVKLACDRNFGIGADGLMLLNTKQGYDFEMVYFNSNGHLSTMCGNGGRCIVKFALDCGIVLSDYNFLAVDGPHKASFDARGWVQLKMKDVSVIEQKFDDFIIDTGSPHYIKLVGEVMTEDVYNEGRKIRYSEEYKAEGINVNFVEQTDHWITVRTYERGVENETLSCGTGVTASALISAHNDFGFNRIEVKTRGGHLAVEYDKKGDEHFENIYLCGPAKFVFSGQIELKD